MKLDVEDHVMQAYINKADPVTEEQSIATIHMALELGVSHIDSSDFYGWGANEVQAFLSARKISGH